MSTVWIDVTDANGVKVGAGPITTALSWYCEPALDRVGPWNFEMPADDPRADYLWLKRRVLCWTAEPAGPRLLGGGTINSVQRTVNEAGEAIVQVAGNDLLDELNYRNVGELQLVDRRYEHPCECYYSTSDDPAVKDVPHGFAPQDLMIDYAPGDVDTYETWDDNMESRWLWIKHPLPFRELAFKVKTVSGVYSSAEFALQYWNGSEFTDVSCSATPAAPTPLFGAADYRIVWDGDPASDWVMRDADTGYLVRLRPTALETGVQIYDVACLVDYPDRLALARILAYAPAGWSLDAGNGYTTIKRATELGPNLITNASFESYTGTPDDGVSDAVTGWTVAGTDANDLVEITATAQAGAAAVKITNTDMFAKPRLTQPVAVEDASDYVLTLGNRGDGTRDGYFVITKDNDPSFGNRIVSYQWTANRTTTYGTYTQEFRVPAGIETLYLELRGPDYQYAGTAYWDNLSLRRRIGGEVYLQFAYESAMEALVKVAEQTGEHFILSPSGARQVLWLRDDVRDSGLRAIAYADYAGVTDDLRDVALIMNLTEQSDGYDLCSRVYPFGGGSGSERATLADTTRSAPDGYTLDKAANCLIRDQCEATGGYGRIDYRLDAPEIVQITASAASRTFAANALFDKAYNYLRRHSALNLAPDGDAPRVYNATLAKCERALLPGYTLHATFDRYAGGNRRIHVDGDFWILAAAIRADAGGVATVGVQFATVDIPPRRGEQAVAQLIRDQRAMRAHRPGA